MRIHHTTTSGPTRRRRGLPLLVAAGAGAASLVIGAVPAYANDTTKYVAADGQSVTFATGDSSRGVNGNVTFVVGADGNWSIVGTGHNSHLLVRTFHWTCHLSWGPSTVTHSSAKKAAPGKKTRTSSGEAYDPNIQADFAAIADHGTADCDIVIG